MFIFVSLLLLLLLVGVGLFVFALVPIELFHDWYNKGHGMVLSCLWDGVSKRSLVNRKE